MVFTKPEFAGFFCLVFAVYWWLPRQRWRNLWVLAASCYFYMSWNPWLILLLIGSTSVDYLVALRLETTASSARRRLLVLLSITINLSLLAFFKYTVFALDTTRAVCNFLGLPLDVPTLKIILPLGISFYTFEAISYIVDVYRGKIRAVRNLLDYGLYIMFFPHLVAGPIVRSGDFLPQLGRRKRFQLAAAAAGLQLFFFGLFKKAVIADHLAAVIDPVFAAPGQFASQALWLAVLGYAVQIYCDFSGYSDMAIGLAHTLGFKLPANFRMPYAAVGLTDFWRRWHISLSTWLRDYLYIPLGGNRHGTWLTYRNLLLTMTLGGCWHGASWTFVIWGAYHGLLLALQRACPLPRSLAGAWSLPFRIAGTFLAVCAGWVFFRAQSLAVAGTILRGLMLATPGKVLAQANALVVCACLAAVFVSHLAGSFPRLLKLEQRLPAPVAGAALALFVLLYMMLLPEDGKGFIYFQF